MKHCPECKQNYADLTLSFCLDDGARLIYGEAVDGANTEILPQALLIEPPTRLFDSHTTETDSRHRADESTLVPSARQNIYVWVIGGLVALVITASLIGYRYYNSPNLNSIESVAVLPFVNGSGDPELDYLSDGLSETLIDKLSELPQLKVIARSSSFRYRGTDVDFGEIANTLGVRAIVTGRVSRVNDNLTVRVEMIDAAENRQLWSEQFSRKQSDVLSIQRDIAYSASEKLRVKLSGAQEQQFAKRETVNPLAYELLLKGRHSSSKGGTDNFKKAAEYLEQAIAVDPNYALAYAELSFRYSSLAVESLADPKVYLPKAETAARKALELDENLAEAHLAISGVYLNRWQWEEAASGRKRAIELDPNSARAHDRYSVLLTLLGRHDEAIAEAQRAKELDPLSLVTALGLGHRMHFARRYDEAIAVLKKALESDPNHPFAYFFLGYAYAGKGQFKEAIAAYQEAIRLGNKGTSIQIYLGAAYAQAGERGKAYAILKQLQTTDEYASPCELAILYGALGDKEAAFQSFEKAYAEHDLQLTFLKIDPAFDPLRHDPRYDGLMQRVGLPL